MAEFTQALGGYYTPFLIAAPGASAVGIAIAVSVGTALAIGFAAVGLVGAAFVLFACREAQRPLSAGKQPWVEARYVLGAVISSAGLGGVLLSVLAADAPMVVQTIVVMMALAVVGIANGSGSGRPKVAAAKALCLGVPMAAAIAVKWPWPWGPVAGAGVLIYGILCIIIARRSFDIQIELLRARERNRAERERMEVAVAHMNQAMAILDADLRLLVINQRALELLGLESLDLAVAPDFAELLVSAPNMANAVGERDEFLARASLLAAARQQFNTVVRLNDKRMIDLEFVPVPGGGWVSVLRDNTSENNAIAQLQQELRRCPLTGLPNGRALFEEVERRLADGRPVCLMMINLDGFALVNDQFGHAMGDRMLRRIGFRLRTADGGLFAAKLAGDRYGVIADIADAGAAEALGRRLIATVDAPAHFDEAQVQVGAAVGYAMAPADAGHAEPLLRAANLAFAAAESQRGSALCRFQPSMLEQSVQNAGIQVRVRAALRAGNIDVAYQPIVELVTAKVLSVEALVRWPNDGSEAITAETLAAIADAHGQAGRLRQLVMAKATKAVAALPGAINLWLNVSVLDLKDGSIVDDVAAAMADAGLPISRLVLEITETALMTDVAACEHTLDRLRALGARVAMDDFGAGFSSLDRLRRLPINALKISGSLLAGAGDDPIAGRVFRLAAGLGQVMNLIVVAEGVETSRDLDLVRFCGIQHVQGFAFSPPVAAAELPDAIARAETAAHAASPQAAH
ncbi:EAL domain-containing protein [Sandarakinorhabdus sp.]|uniref:EAL domain-containing protein n=1 Tax=Sandarakinorhabdus sp. TaxID=1916663 RepID=UPI00333FB3DD